MTFDTRICRDCNLLVCHGTGRITSQEIIDAFRGAFSQPGFRPGLDRLTVFDPATSLAEIDKEHLRDIKELIRAVESPVTDGLPRIPRFKSAFVSADVSNQMLVQLYRAMWESDPGSAARYEIFPSVAAALDWLGTGCDAERLSLELSSPRLEGLRPTR